MEKERTGEKERSGLRPQIKICGFTVPAEAAACAAAGIDAVGLVFFPPSPRHLEMEQAATVAAAVPADVVKVGVFVNPDWDLLATAVARCGLGIVQLHGQEPPELAQRIRAELGVRVIKALFARKEPGFEMAEAFDVYGFLVECGRGYLPGGNAEVWDWAGAESFVRAHPTALAGGLTPDNVQAAILAAMPAAVDASSGLEVAPGRKDPEKVRRFVAAVNACAGHYEQKGVDPGAFFH